MKKFFSLLAVLALVGMAGTAFADSFTSDSKTAIATFRSGEIGFSATLYNWNSTYTGTTATNITWTTTSISLGSSDEQFKCADVYALIESNITVPNAKVYVYQDNKHNSTTEYVAGDGRLDEKNVTRYDGLVKSGGTGYATLTYRCRTLADAKENITELPTAWPSWEPYDGVRRFIDKTNSNWSTIKTAEDVVIATTDGTWLASGDWGTTWEKQPIVMFFGAQFVNVLGGDTFGTNTITFNTTVE